MKKSLNQLKTYHNDQPGDFSSATILPFYAKAINDSGKRGSKPVMEQNTTH